MNKPLVTVHFIGILTSPVFARSLNKTCTDFEFVCDDGSCIDAEFYCDGIAHCADDSDEKRCGSVNNEDDFDEDLTVNAFIGLGAAIGVGVLLLGIFLCFRNLQRPRSGHEVKVSDERRPSSFKEYFKSPEKYRHVMSVRKDDDVWSPSDSEGRASRKSSIASRDDRLDRLGSGRRSHQHSPSQSPRSTPVMQRKHLGGSQHTTPHSSPRPLRATHSSPLVKTKEQHVTRGSLKGSARVQQPNEKPHDLPTVKIDKCPSPVGNSEM